MNKILISVVAAGALLGASRVSHAQFGGLGARGGGGGSNIDAFLQSATEAEGLMRKSSWNIADALLAKDKVDALKEKRNAIEKITDPKEKAAKLRELDKDVNSQLATMDFVAKSKELEKEPDKKKKETTAAGIFNFSLGLLKDTELLSQGQKLATTPPSPAIANKLPQVKDFVASLGNQLDSIKKVGEGLKQLSAAVGLKALPTKASDKPQPVAD